MTINKNLYGTVLTYTAPSANYGGDSGGSNRRPIQKITIGRFEYPFISPEAIRNALRETFVVLDLPCNRERLSDEEQLAVRFKDYPNDSRFADDFFMGWLVTAKPEERKKIIKELQNKGRDPKAFTFKRDSILRMNMALALEPYRHNTVFTQSPQDKTPEDIKAHKNDKGSDGEGSSNLLYRETVVTAFQYPFALSLADCAPHLDWTRTLLKAIGVLNGVAGNHARSYYEMAPASLVLRLTSQLVAGYDTYGFRLEEAVSRRTEDEKHRLPEIVDGILQSDYPGEDFFIGGRVVKDLDEATRKALEEKGATLDRSPQRLLATVAEKL